MTLVVCATRRRSAGHAPEAEVQHIRMSVNMKRNTENSQDIPCACTVSGPAVVCPGGGFYGGHMARGEMFPIINCLDLATTRDWYERVLSGTVSYRFPEEGEPDYLTVRIGAGQVALGRGTAPALYGETPRPATGHAVDLCVYVPDLDAVVEKAAPDLVVPPAEMPWGERIAYLRDPEGTMILAIQDDA